MDAEISFIRIEKARARLAVSRRQIYRLVQAGDLPPLRKLGPRCSGFNLREFDAAMRRINRQATAA